MSLRRLLAPASLAVVGGGAWCAQVIAQAQRFGFKGPIWPVHPNAKLICGLPVFRSVSDLPGVPDAAFVGVNRHATLDIVAVLAAAKAGGAVCFASGFSEASAEDKTGDDLQARLVRAAGPMPILGPNCYGFINAMDGALLWPDQHGCDPVDRGVAILTQSSNIAINLTMQRRALPLAFVAACGNMAQTSQAEIAAALLDDPRITAIGLHIEGFGDLRQWETLAEKAHERNVPLVAIKVGRSSQAMRAAVSHTASLVGGDAGAQALLDRLGIARLNDLPSFLETLKLLHCTGPLASNRIASISCSGGEASLIADQANGLDLAFPALTSAQRAALSTVLGPMVALANPLDYHTYIWRDTDAMAQAWAAMTGPGIGLTLSIVDYPTTDAGDWRCATDAALRVRADTGAPFAVVASLPELMPPDVAAKLMAGGVVPMMGLGEALAAAEAAARFHGPDPVPIVLPNRDVPARTLDELAAKSALASFGLPVPEYRQARSVEEAARQARDLVTPLALKGLYLAHKSEHGAVRLGLGVDDVAGAAARIGSQAFLVEEMVSDGSVELLVGIVSDPAHGFVLTLAAGGVLTELMRDTVSLLVPAQPSQVQDALARLRIYPTLIGYRGKPAVDMAALLRAIDAIQAYVLANATTCCEVEVNPLICTPTRAVAVDALIRLTDRQEAAPLPLRGTDDALAPGSIRRGRERLRKDDHCSRKEGKA